MQPYAPLPPSLSTPHPRGGVSASSAAVLSTEMRLITTAAVRSHYETLAELYSLVITLEHLERGFIKDSIAPAAYTPVCLRLLSQYKTLLLSTSRRLPSLPEFCETWGVSVERAVRRLEMGVPATVEHGGAAAAAAAAAAETEDGGAGGDAGGGGPGGRGGAGDGAGGRGTSAKKAAEATQNFITAMDALRLSFRAKDELHPLLAAAITAVDSAAGGEWEGRGEVVRWLIRLNQMRPGDEISVEEGREMLWDLEKAYNAFLEGL
jgi:ESCRT-I complex subunit VPS28